MKVSKEEFLEVTVSSWSKITSDNITADDYVREDLENLYDFMDRQGWIIIKRGDLEKIRRDYKELSKIYPDDRSSRLVIRLINWILEH